MGIMSKVSKDTDGPKGEINVLSVFLIRLIFLGDERQDVFVTQRRVEKIRERTMKETVKPQPKCKLYAAESQHGSTTTDPDTIICLFTSLTSA